MNFKTIKQRNKKLVILHTSDIHGYLFNTNYVTDANVGLLAYYKYIKNIKKKYKHVLILDTGDLIQGSPLTYYLKKNFEGYNPIIDLLNELEFDIVTLGNHEFNYGYKYLTDSYNSFKGSIVSANIDGIEKHLNSTPYKIFNFKGFKVGVIGFTTSAVVKWEKKDNIDGLTFNPIVPSYKKYENELKKKCDFIICLYHGGFETDLKNLNEFTEKPTGENAAGELLKNFSSIDLLLTGHQHRNINIRINNTLCRQTLANAQNMSVIHVDMKKKHITKSSETTAEILLKTNLADYENVIKNLNPNILKVQEETQNYLDQIIGSLDKDILVNDLFDARFNSHPLVNLINKVQLDITKADVSAISLFDSAIGFKKYITIRNLIANYPFPNTLVVLEVKKEVIKEAIEVSASYFNIENGEVVINKRFTTPKTQHFHYDMFDGLNYEIDLTKEVGNRVNIIGFTNDVDNQKIKLVVNNFRASNHDWYPMYENAKIIKEIPFDMVELLINYISEKKYLIVDEKPRYKIKTT